MRLSHSTALADVTTLADVHAHISSYSKTVANNAILAIVEELLASIEFASDEAVKKGLISTLDEFIVKAYEKLVTKVTYNLALLDSPDIPDEVRSQVEARNEELRSILYWLLGDSYKFSVGKTWHMTDGMISSIVYSDGTVIKTGLSSEHFEFFEGKLKWDEDSGFILPENHEAITLTSDNLNTILVHLKSN